MLTLTNGAVGGTFCLSKAGLKIGNSDSKDVDIAAPNGAGVDFSIDGVLYHKADAADIPITAATEQAALTTCLYLVTLNTSGTLATVKGTEVLTADLAGGNAVLKIPQPAENTCPIGMLKVVTALTATFTAGTTDLNASNVTTTYQDIMALPSSPRTS